MPKSGSQGSRGSAWCFTLHVDTKEDDKVEFDENEMRFLKQQLERGVIDQKLHWQGVVKFKARVSLRKAKEICGFESIHMEEARCWAKAVQYVEKDETHVQGSREEFGKDVSKGTRTDLEGLCDLVKTGASERSLAEANMSCFARCHKGLGALRRALDKPRLFLERKVVLLLGPTGVGKTRFVFENYPLDDVYNVMSVQKGWFCGYDGHKVALFDECGEGMLDVNMLKKLCDIYPMRVEVKGGSVAWTPEVIFLTSNDPLWMWYLSCNKTDHMAALQRRIKTFTLPDEEEECREYLGLPSKLQRVPPSVAITDVASDSDGDGFDMSMAIPATLLD